MAVLHASDCWDDKYEHALYAPILKDFTFEGNYDRGSDRIHLLAALLRAGTAPQLQRLHIDNHSINMPNTFGHSNLKSLSIVSSRYDDRTSTLKSFLTVLKSMPCLEALELSNWFPSDVDSRDDDPANIVALPHLRFVELYHEDAPCANLLIFLDIPPACSVWARGRCMQFGIPGVAHYLAKFNGHYSTQHMVVTHNYVQLLPTASNGHVTHSSGDLSTDRVGPEFIVEDLLLSTFMVLLRGPQRRTFPQIVNLTVFCSSKDSIESLGALFGRIPTVQILHICDTTRGEDIFTKNILNVPGTVVALATGTRSASTLLSAAPLPQLRELIIGFFPNEAAAKCMMSCLVTRRSYGLGPEVVKIRLSEATRTRHPDSKMTRTKLERLFVQEFGWTDWGSYITFE